MRQFALFRTAKNYSPIVCSIYKGRIED